MNLLTFGDSFRRTFLVKQKANHFFSCSYLDFLLANLGKPQNKELNFVVPRTCGTKIVSMLTHTHKISTNPVTHKHT